MDRIWHIEELPVPKSPADELESENQGERLDSESKETYVGHSDEKAITLSKTSRNWRFDPKSRDDEV